MKSRFLAIFLLSFGLCFGLSFAQGNHLLYQIKKDGYQTSYVFGTVHLIPDSLYFFTKNMEKALSKSDLVVLEIDNSSDIQQAQKLMVQPDGKSFELFSKAEKDSVIDWGSKLLGITPEIFERSFQYQKPFVLLQLGVLNQMKGNNKKYEQEIEAKASRLKIPVKGLETMEFQLSLFDQLPDSILAEMIMESIRYPEKSDSLNTLMYRYYVDQDIEKLALLTNDQDAGSMEKLLFERNRNWIPKMIAFMQTSKCFFAVGAAHLGGDNGLLKLFIQAGFEVIPVKI